MTLPTWNNVKTGAIRIPEVFIDVVLALTRDLDQGRITPERLIWMNTSDIEDSVSLVLGEELQKRVHPQHAVLVQRILKRLVTVLVGKSGFSAKLKEFDMALAQNKTLKITMLGTSGSGKTCYMLGMYAEMVNGVGVQNGITINSVDLDVGSRLLNQWERLVVDEEDRWPPSNTTGTEEYNFNFSYNAKPIMRFNWMDYRGSAMTDTADASDVKSLIDRLIASDCTLLCIPAEAVAQDYKPVVGVRFKTNRMNDLLSRIAVEHNLTSDNPFPIVLVLTKYDEIVDKVSQEEFIKRVQRLFPALFVKEGIWDVAICPVSLGLELAQDKAKGEINPSNLHLPIAFSVWHKLVKMRVDAGLPKNENWLDKVIPGLVGSSLSQSDLKDFEKKILLLSEELKNIPIFRGGAELSGYEDI